MGLVQSFAQYKSQLVGLLKTHGGTRRWETGTISTPTAVATPGTGSAGAGTVAGAYHREQGVTIRSGVPEKHQPRVSARQIESRQEGGGGVGPWLVVNVRGCVIPLLCQGGYAVDIVVSLPLSQSVSLTLCLSLVTMMFSYSVDTLFARRLDVKQVLTIT